MVDISELTESVKGYIEGLQTVLQRKYQISEEKALNMITSSYIMDSLIDYPEETLHDDIEAFRDGLKYISQHFGVWREKNGLEGKDLCRTSVALPYKIGCGRGGADWEMVYKIIEEELKDYDVELWRLDE